MADVTYALRQAALSTLIQGVQNQIERSVVLAQLLDVVPADGKNVSWDAKLGTATPTGGPIADGANVTVFNNDAYTPATLEYVTYHEAFATTGRAMAAASVAGGPINNLWSEELNDATERFARKLGRDVYIGTGASDQIHGLVDPTIPAIGDIGVYAGIDRSVQTQWRGNVTDAGGVALTQKLMRDMRRKIYDSSNEKPDLIICDSFQHQKFAETFTPERRYLDEVRMGDGRQIKLAGGYNVLELDGIPVVEDNQCPAGHVLFLNTRRVRWRQLPPPPQTVARFLGQFGLKGTPEETLGARTLRLMAWLLPLAVNGDKYPYSLYVYPCLQVTRPNSCGYIKGLATS